jgi:hypothetical protein
MQHTKEKGRFSTIGRINFDHPKLLILSYEGYAIVTAVAKKFIFICVENGQIQTRIDK